MLNPLLVFGATGHPGKHLTLLALENASIATINVFVRSAVNLDAQIKSNPNVSVIEGSIDDVALIKKPLLAAISLVVASNKG